MFGIIASMIGCAAGLQIMVDDKKAPLLSAHDGDGTPGRDEEPRGRDLSADVAINVADGDPDSEPRSGTTTADSSPSDSGYARLKKCGLYTGYTGGCIALTAAVAFAYWCFRCGVNDLPREFCPNM